MGGCVGAVPFGLIYKTTPSQQVPWVLASHIQHPHPYPIPSTTPHKTYLYSKQPPKILRNSSWGCFAALLAGVVLASNKQHTSARRGGRYQPVLLLRVGKNKSNTKVKIPPALIALRGQVPSRVKK